MDCSAVCPSAVTPCPYCLHMLVTWAAWRRGRRELLSGGRKDSVKLLGQVFDWPQPFLDTYCLSSSWPPVTSECCKTAPATSLAPLN